jgi:acyl carrier protein
MTDNQLNKDVTELIAKIIKIPAAKIDPQADLFRDLGVDSLLGVEIFAALDKKYGLDVPETKLRDVKSVNDIIGLVRDYLSKK